MFPTHVIQEMVEPVVRLAMEVSTVALLGISFCVQTVSIVISLDYALGGFFKALGRGLTLGLSSLLPWLPHLQRQAVIHALLAFGANILWTHLMYSIDDTSRAEFFFAPAARYALLNCLLAWATSRIATSSNDPADRSRSTATVLVLTAIATAMVCRTVSRTPEESVGTVLLLLRSTIDGVCCALDSLLSPADMEHSSQYMIEMCRALFWVSISFHQLLVRARTARMRFVMLLAHDIIAVSSPTRNLVRKVTHDRYIADKFPRLTAAELEGAEHCSVCLCPHTPRSVRLPCRHMLHAHCLTRILQGSRGARCPMCRAALLESAVGTGEGAGEELGGLAGGLGALGVPQGTYTVSNVISVRILTPVHPAAAGSNTIIRITSGNGTGGAGVGTQEERRRRMHSMLAAVAGGLSAGEVGGADRVPGAPDAAAAAVAADPSAGASAGASAQGSDRDHGVGVSADRDRGRGSNRVTFRTAVPLGSSGGSGGGVQYIRVNLREEEGTEGASSSSGGSGERTLEHFLTAGRASSAEEEAEAEGVEAMEMDTPEEEQLATASTSEEVEGTVGHKRPMGEGDAAVAAVEVRAMQSEDEDVDNSDSSGSRKKRQKHQEG